MHFSFSCVYVKFSVFLLLMVLPLPFFFLHHFDSVSLVLCFKFPQSNRTNHGTGPAVWAQKPWNSVAGIIGYFWCDCNNRKKYLCTHTHTRAGTDKTHGTKQKEFASICQTKPQFSELFLKANNNTVKSVNLFPQPLSINYSIFKQNIKLEPWRNLFIDVY